MSIIFSKLRWQNFLSTGNTFTEIDLKRSNTTLIVGENGAGKSTILDALSYVLYGKPFRKINKPQLVNTINNKNLRVEVEFDSSDKKYKIIRGMKPNVFEIYQDNKIINQNAEMKDYQEMLEKHILKLNHKSFSQIVILGSASFTPFMQLSASHRREVIEDLLDIQIFSTMNNILKSKMQQLKEDLTTADMNVMLTEQKIDLQKKNIQNLRTNNDELILSYKEKIEVEEATHQKYTLDQTQICDSINELTDSISDREKVQAKLKKIYTLEKQLEEKKNKIQQDVFFYHNNDNCPTCKQELDLGFKTSKIDHKTSQLSEIEDALEKLEIERNSYSLREEEIYKVQTSIEQHNKKLMDIVQKMNICKATIQSLQSNIAQIEMQSKKIEQDADVIKKLNEELTDQISFKNKLIETKDLQEIASSVLKDSGIKTKIVKQYIPVMNKLINKYLASMDFFVNFELDENFEEKIKSRYRDEFSYESFSEGEKLRIDLALLFTWRAIAKLRNSASTNLLIMDEIFDSSLDNSGTEEFLKILQTLTQDTNVFVISHKGDSLYDKFNSIIKFEKKKNFSRIAA